MNNLLSSTAFRVLVLPPLLLLVVISSLMLVPSYLGTSYLDQMQKELSKLEIKYKRLFSDVNFLLDQYSIYEKYGDLFYDLEKRGLVSSEKRPVWLDNILLFGYAMQFKDLKASFRPQVVVRNKILGGNKLDSNLFKLNPITIRASMPLDVDFFRFFNFTKNNLTQYSFFEKCDFKSPYVNRKINSMGSNSDVPESIFSNNKLASTVDMICDFNIITSHPRKRQR